MSELPTYLPGYPPMYGVRQEGNKVQQGGNITFSFKLPSNYGRLIVTLKQSLTELLPLWRGYINYGLEINGNNATVTVPTPVSQSLPAGMYYIAVSECVNNNDSGKVLYVNNFVVNPGANSTNPVVVGSLVNVPDPANAQ